MVKPGMLLSSFCRSYVPSSAHHLLSLRARTDKFGGLAHSTLNTSAGVSVCVFQSPQIFLIVPPESSLGAENELGSYLLGTFFLLEQLLRYHCNFKQSHTCY
jgi:hypothetical protein